MKKSALFITIIFLVLILAAGCGPAADPVDNGSRDDAEPDVPVKDDITIVIASEPNTLDPQQSGTTFDIEVFSNIFDGLVRLDRNHDVVPSLAESWEISDDNLTYTFVLREGVKFHNGEDFSADDVVFTIERGRESPFLANYYENIGDVIKVDDYTVEIQLTEPFAPLIRVLAMPLFGILNETAAEAAGDDFEKEPVGTGPYKFVAWDFGNNITLTRNDDYFRGPAAIKDVLFRFIGDSSTSLAALEAGEIDYTYQFPAIAISSIEENPDLSLIREESALLHMIFVNNNQEPFDNPAVRQAISYALERSEILEVAAEGEGVVTDIPVNSSTFGYTENIEGYSQDIDRAAELLADAGYPDGFSASIIASDDDDRKIAEVAQFQLARVGIEIEIDMMEIGAAIEDMMSGNYDMGVLAFSNIMLDADFISLIYDSRLADGGLNIANYKNPDADDLFDRARKETDEAARLQLYEDVFRVIVEDVAFVPLYFSYNLVGHSEALNVDYISASTLTEVYNLSW